jgi:signal transduction histidine kinase
MIAVDQSNDKKRSLNLYSYLSDVIQAMTPKTSKKNIRILLAGDKEFKINTYPGAVSQLTTNLIDNAFVHAFADIYNGEIKISYQHTDSHLEITFQDNGIGMEAMVLKNIFEPFYTTNRKEGGTGLGLSVVYNLVTQTFLGTISCHSKPNELTKFTINIPLNT